MLAYFDVPLGWKELFTRTARDSMEDDIFGLAAQLAYYAFLALIPALLCLLAFASFLPLEQAIDDMIVRMRTVAPPEMVELIRGQILEIASGDRTGLFTLGFLAALWSSSAALVAIVGALNKAYDVEEGRPWWKVRLTAIFLTLAVAALVILALLLVVVGPQLAEYLGRTLHLGSAFVWTWQIVQWPIVLLFIVSAIGLVYYFAPDVEQDWVWLTPGAVVATVLWLVASLGFRIYVVNFGSYNETYGALAGVMVLLLWFYISGLALLVGAELNAEIEHASPHAKAAGEKRPGEKKVIGARAARAFREQQEAKRGVAAGPPVTAPIPERLSWTASFARTAALVGGLVASLFRKPVKR